MKQNKYDNAVFFEKYAAMDRSQRGLDGAGEWQSLRALLPDFAGKRVLDLGCGYGWHCEYAALHGAKSVLGADLSERMLDEARAHHAHPQIEYRRLAMEDAAFAESAFDVVLSSLAFHYIASFDDMVARIYRWLTPGGAFVFSCEHPVFTAQGPQQWVTDESGKILHFPVDRYFEEGARDASFLGEQVVKYHRTLTGYVGALLRQGFVLTGLTEPQPPQQLVDMIPAMADELRRPMMLILAARKPEA